MDYSQLKKCSFCDNEKGLNNKIPFSSLLIKHKYYSLQIKQKIAKTSIVMNVHGNIIYTDKIPSTYKILQKYLPRVLLSKCFNKRELPFNIEVKDTEIGHLFEHILLEYMCQIKMDRGYKNVTFSGYTDWNWVKYPKGTFKITINSNTKGSDIFNHALDSTIKLTNTIMESINPLSEISSREAFSPMDILSTGLPFTKI